MQVLTGTKREITLMEWDELIDKPIRNIEINKGCYQKFRDTCQLDLMKENAEKLIKITENLKEVIAFMDEHNIK